MIENKEESFNPEVILKLCLQICEKLDDLPIEPFCFAMNELVVPGRVVFNNNFCGNKN